MSMLANLNYIQRVELLVIFAVLVFAGYIFYSLDLYKKDK